MTTDSDTTVPPPQCESTLVINEGSVYGCEQDRGHDGPHTSIGPTWSRIGWGDS